MDVINAKLWDKYQNLKKRKVGEREERRAEIEAFVRNYQLAMEEMVEALRSENDELRNQLFAKEDEYAESRKLLMEERRKTKELSNEIEMVHNHATPQKDSMEENERKKVATPNLLEHAPGSSSKDLHAKAADLHSNSSIGHQCTQSRDIDISCASCKDQIAPDCCRGMMVMTGKEYSPREKCLFQILLESIVGVQLFIDLQAEVPHFSVIHQSSGYSFKLTWLPNHFKEDDGEWLYQVSSLGTLERVALGWMKEDVIFSSTMFPLFFQRVSRALGRVQ